MKENNSDFFEDIDADIAPSTSEWFLHLFLGIFLGITQNLVLFILYIIFVLVIATIVDYYYLWRILEPMKNYIDQMTLYHPFKINLVMGISVCIGSLIGYVISMVI